MENGQEDNFDLEAYISSYTSHTKVDRLLFIADKCRGKPLELEALKLAATELQQTVRETFNVGKYEQVMDRIGGRLGPAFSVDQNVLQAVEKAAAARQELLETELHSSKSNLIKESVRMGYNDLGDFFYHKGDLQNAFKSYVRARDYCSTPKHIIIMCLNVIKTALEMNNTLHVQNYVAKAEQTPEVASDNVTAAKLKCAAGLAALATRKYKQAAKAFVNVSPDLGSSYSEVMSPADVAMYGGLTALASFDRPELKMRVMDNIGFRELLELTPEMREVIHHFYHSRYAACLAQLETLKPQLGLDLHLSPHVASLYAAVRHKALVQYTSPFSSVALPAMADAFNTSLGALEKELAQLIMDGQVTARIDSQAKVLYARHTDVRAATFHKLVQFGEAYIRDSKALMLRASLLKHDMIQRGGGGRRGGGGGGGDDDGDRPGGSGPRGEGPRGGPRGHHLGGPRGPRARGEDKGVTEHMGWMGGGLDLPRGL